MGNNEKGEYEYVITDRLYENQNIYLTNYPKTLKKDFVEPADATYFEVGKSSATACEIAGLFN